MRVGDTIEGVGRVVSVCPPSRYNLMGKVGETLYGFVWYEDEGTDGVFWLTESELTG